MQLDSEAITQLGVGGALGSAALVWFIRSMIRRVSRDKVELAKDRIELNVYDALKDDNERKETLILRLETRLDELSGERNDAVSKVGALSAEVEGLREQIEGLKQHIASLEQQMTEQTNLITQQRELIREFMHRLNYDPLTEKPIGGTT